MTSPKTDIWMPLYIGDYLADTTRLTTEQHGAYLLLLMDYWRNGPPPDDPVVLQQITKLSPVAWNSHQAVLMRFFTKGSDGLLHQKRADVEKSKSEFYRDRASHGGQARAEKAARDSSGRFAPASHQFDDQLDDQLDDQPKSSTSPSPSPTSKYKSSLVIVSDDAHAADRALGGIRPEEFGNVWNRNCGGVLPIIKEFTDTRRKRALLRIRQGLTLERFEAAVKVCTQKSFLRGEGNRHWKARYDWLMQNDTNITRVFEEDWAVDESTRREKVELLSGPLERGAN
jgi:uncharacterized protein YdaU (DUF1376 family)